MSAPGANTLLTNTQIVECWRQGGLLDGSTDLGQVQNTVPAGSSNSPVLKCRNRSPDPKSYSEARILLRDSPLIRTVFAVYEVSAGSQLPLAGPNHCLRVSAV